MDFLKDFLQARLIGCDLFAQLCVLRLRRRPQNIESKIAADKFNKMSSVSSVNYVFKLEN